MKNVNTGGQPDHRARRESRAIAWVLTTVQCAAFNVDHLYHTRCCQKVQQMIQGKPTKKGTYAQALHLRLSIALIQVLLLLHLFYIVIIIVMAALRQCAA